MPTLRKKERPKKNNQTLHLKKLELEEQTKPKVKKGRK